MAKNHLKIFLDFLSFSALIIFAICKIIGILNKYLELGINTGMLNTIGTIFLLICVLWSAWTFASGCKKVWRIIYFVLLILLF